MEVLKAYKENDYFTIYALIKNSTNVFMHFRIEDDKYELKPYDDGIAFTDYCTHRNSEDQNDFSDNFDPITAEPLLRYALWYDYDKYKEDAIEEAKEEIKEKMNVQNFKNFNSVAILQNILDSGAIFDNLPMIDLIVGKGLEVLNFVKDGANLLSSASSNIQSPFLKASSLKKRDKVYIARDHGYRILRGKYGEDKEIASFGNKKQVVFVDVKKIEDGSVWVHGYLDVYKNYNHENGTSAGNAKLSIESIKNDWLIIKGDIREDEILTLLKNRHFRETQYEKALILREVLNLLRAGKDYNFSGGVKYLSY